ncbi:hypothetical protein [Devosia nitrariae]|nr:hypothetical protein [Devosia nitrariae]
MSVLRPGQGERVDAQAVDQLLIETRQAEPGIEPAAGEPQYGAQGVESG